MSPKEVLEHEWHNGDKVYVVVCEYSHFFVSAGCSSKNPVPQALGEKADKFDEKPICVVEGTVSELERTGVKMDWEHVRFDIESEYKDKENITYCSYTCSAFVTYGTSRDRYDHHKLCINTFLDKKEADKRFKELVKKWNRGMEVLQKIQEEEVKRLENELIGAKKLGNNYFSKFLIK